MSRCDSRPESNYGSWVSLLHETGFRSWYSELGSIFLAQSVTSCRFFSSGCIGWIIFDHIFGGSQEVKRYYNRGPSEWTGPVEF